MILLNGKTLSTHILDKLKLDIRNLKLEIKLSVILVGSDPSSLKYVSLKQQKCQELGINFDLHHLPENVSQTDLLSLISTLNQDSSVTGFFIQLPLPAHLDKQLLLSSIALKKDVDGLNPASAFTPAVVLGIIKLLASYSLSFTDKKIVIVNDSELIGKPLLKYFPNATLCNRQTADLTSITSTADLLITATGIKNIITAPMVKEGSVAIDVANGDIDFAGVASKVNYLTPTYGCIGPLTIACLLENLFKTSAPAH